MVDQPRRRKAPCVDMRTDVHKDERYAALADFAQMSGGHYEAVGRMHGLYSWCVDRVLLDAPDDCKGYAVPEAVVRRFIGPVGVAAILGEGCDDLALGVRRPDGLIYLRGTSDYVAARRQLAATCSAGGKARSSLPRPPGKFVSSSTNVQPETSGEPAEQPAGTPARTSDLPSSSFLKEKKERGASRSPVLPGMGKPETGQRAIEWFTTRYQAAYGAGQSVEWSKQAANFHRYAKEHGVTEVIARINRLFDGRGPDWIKPPFAPGAVIQHWNLLVVDSKPTSAPVVIRETRML